MSKNWLLSAMLVAGILAPSSNMFADLRGDLVKKFKDEKLLLAVGSPPLVFMAASLYCLMYNQPKADFVSKGKWKNLLNPKLLTTQPKQYFQNVSDVYWYRWIGQYFKDNKVKMSADGDVRMSKKKSPHGIMGNAYTHLYTLGKTSGVIGDLAKVVPTILSFCFLAEKLELFGLGESKAASAPITEERVAEISGQAISAALKNNPQK